MYKFSSHPLRVAFYPNLQWEFEGPAKFSSMLRKHQACDMCSRTYLKQLLEHAFLAYSVQSGLSLDVLVAHVLSVGKGFCLFLRYVQHLEVFPNIRGALQIKLIWMWMILSIKWGFTLVLHSNKFQKQHETKLKKKKKVID